MKNILMLFAFFFLVTNIIGQSENKLLRKGNKQYQAQQFGEAEVSHQKALEENPMSSKAAFNLGNSLYEQEQFEEAERKFSQVTAMSKAPMLESNASYNLGNSMLKQQRYAESVEAFKQALRLNPNDDEARYNLEYARRMLKQQQEQKQDQNEEDQQDQQEENQDQDQQDQQDQQQEGEQEEQKNEQQDQGEGQEQQRQQQPQQQMTKEDAERMLKALSAEERKTLDKLNLERMQAARGAKRDRDW
jgi:Ca-activated chloride channel homolog